MIDSTGGIANLAQAMQKAKVSEQHQTAMLKKINDMTKKEGEQAVQLLQSVPGAKSSSSHAIDVYA